MRHFVVGLVFSLLCVGLPVMAKVPAKELVELGKQCEQRVIKLRGLKIKKPIRWEVTSKEQVRAYLKETLAEQYAPGEMEAEGDAMKALGLIPANMQYKEFILKLYEEQVGGYYDPKKETFFLADWIAPSMQESIISHELTHALQDQHFDIDKFVERVKGNSDAMYARAALVEGEATLVMMLDSMRNMGIEVELEMLDLDGTLGSLLMTLSTSQFPSFAEAPRALKETLMFPYLKGLNFVIFGKKQGAWAKIDKVYDDLPVSTEQILHPEKYFLKRDIPITVVLPAIEKIVGRSWKKIYDDVLGEFMTRHLLAGLDDRDEENKAAAGWDGDKFWVFKRDDELAWVQISFWDSEKDATEFAGAFAKTVAQRKTGFVQQPTTAQPMMTWKSKKDRVVLVERRANKILIIDNLEQDKVSSLRQAAFD